MWQGCQLVQAKKYSPTLLSEEGIAKQIDIGYVGEVVRVNPDCYMLKSRVIFRSLHPMVLEMMEHNINADTVAGEVAAALVAEKLILLTDTRGLYLTLPMNQRCFQHLILTKLMTIFKRGIGSGCYQYSLAQQPCQLGYVNTY